MPVIKSFAHQRDGDSSPKQILSVVGFHLPSKQNDLIAVQHTRIMVENVPPADL